MNYYCIINKKNNKFLASFPDIPKLTASAASEEKTLAMAKKKLDSFLEAEISIGNSVSCPACNSGHPVKIANHIAVAIQLRKLRGSENQTNIAKKLGISYQAYQRLENPRRANPTVKTLEKIAQVFGRELFVQIS